MAIDISLNAATHFDCFNCVHVEDSATQSVVDVTALNGLLRSSFYSVMWRINSRVVAASGRAVSETDSWCE